MIKSLIRKILSILSGAQNFYGFVMSIFASFKSLKYLRFRSIYTIAVNQTFFTGVNALFLIVTIALMLGGTIIIQAIQNFPKFGIEGFIGNLLVIIIARELGPLVTAIIVISRSGSAMAAEIATQKQHKEILSLEIIGIDTRLYIVFPRILASIAAIFTLIIIFDVVGFLGGYLLSLTTVYIPPGIFIESVLNAFSFEDLVLTITKSVIYGTLIPLLASYYGFKTKSYFEIPIDVSKAVVRTLLVIFIINAIISALFYLK